MQHLEHLNPPQRDAVLTQSGPLLVLAGAGTGKTRVITFRMAELIRQGTPADRILSVTFTNKAAREMLERALQLLGKRVPVKPVISTFHSLCVKILRQEITALGYPKTFSIYDRGDQESAARTALRDVRVDDKTMKPGDLLNSISRWKMAGVTPKEATGYTETDLDFLAAVAYRKYQQNLKACGAVDFDDLLLLTLELFREHPDVLERQQSRFDYVQVDEYQDTNSIQFELVSALVKPHGNLCVVGDDDQSIYGWRGAEVEHILGFQQHFPGAKVVRLEDNYRCTEQILSFANALVSHNIARHKKVLRAHKKSKADVRCFAFEDETKEAEFIVTEINNLITHHNVNPNHIAILFRTNEQPRVFEQELRRQRVRYVFLGGQSFFDRREVKDLLAYLKVIAQPADEVSLLRIINVPARGIGATTITKVIKRAVTAGKPVWDVIDEARAARDISGKALESLYNFRDLLQDYREKVERQPRQLSEHLSDLITRIDYDSEIAKQYPKEEMRAQRKSMLDQLVTGVKDYTAHTEGKPSLTGFLEESALLGDDNGFGKQDPMKDQGVRLMTLHSAKGLEFPHVYLVGLEEGLLPHRRSLETGDASIAEERRLMYVGITRAMDHLTITRALARTKWGKKRDSLPSRFLWEMQPEQKGE